MSEDQTSEVLTRIKKLEIAQKALTRFNQAETKGEIIEIFEKYGKNGIGYRALCRILFSNMPIEKAIK